MNIEKVSRYVPITTPSKTNAETMIRKMLISIPRMAFLDKDKESCEFYKLYKSPQELEGSIPKPAGKSPQCGSFACAQSH